MKKQAKLVYIMSQGHSGSTLLDFLIGSIPGTFSTGEMVYFPWQLDRTNKETATIKNESICTCRKDFYNCNIWGNVIKNIERERNINFKKNPYAFDISMNRNAIYRKKNIMHIIFSKLFYSSSKYGLSDFITYIYSKIFSKGIKNNWLLFNLLSKESGAEYIVDSTKDPIRFRLLRSYKSENVKLIILIREVYGVASSGVNYGRKLDIEKSAQSWIKFYNNMVYNSLKNIKDLDYLVIKYEDIANKPENVRNELIDFLKLEKTPFKNFFDTSKYHIIAGNPMRYKKSFSIKYDERWKKILSNEQVKVLQKYQDNLLPFFNK